MRDFVVSFRSHVRPAFTLTFSLEGGVNLIRSTRIQSNGRVHKL